ncbi:hypothetical protein BDV19DRAFT_397189 [Aspergillus venezuelensis]
MASTEEQTLAPDSALLSQIFPNQIVSDITTEILSQTFEACTFSAHLKNGRGEKYAIRLENPGTKAPAVAAMQDIGGRIIGTDRATRPGETCRDLALEVFGTGQATLENGRKVAYSVSEFALHATTLEDIVDDLSDTQISHIIAQIMKGVNYMQVVNPDAEDFRSRLADIEEAQSSKPNRIKRGGPSTGWFDTPVDLFRGMLAALDTYKRCTVTETEDGGLKVQSSVEGVEPVTLSKLDMVYHSTTATFCHNDLEPRNVLVREKQVGVESEEIQYELVAIIDWEMAGVYPEGFEMAIKDRVLGSSNLNFRWYRELRDQVAQIPRRAAAPSAFKSPIPAFDVVVRSNAAVRGTVRNVGARVAAKWIEREQLILSEDPSKGWVRHPDAGKVKRYTKEDNKELELTVLKEMGIVPS